MPSCAIPTRCPCCGGNLSLPMRGRQPGEMLICMGCNVVLQLDASRVPRVPEPGHLGTVLGEDLGFVDRPKRQAGRGR